MTNPNRQNLDRLCLHGATAAVAVAIPLLLAIAGGESEQYVENRRHIEQMTLAQRARLDENLRLFREMDLQQRRRLRALHAEIAAAPDGDELRRTLARYESWLSTLSPFQRKQLRETSDPDERLELARQFKQKQAEQSPGAGDLAVDLAMVVESTPQLTAEELARVMSAISGRLGLDPGALQQLPELRRYLYILNEAIRRREGRPPNARFAWMDDDLFTAIVAALPDDKYRNFITAVPAKDLQRRQLVESIIYALRLKLRDEILLQDSTSEELAQLSPAEQEHLQDLDARGRRRWLVRRRMRALFEDLDDVRPVFLWMLSRRSPRRPGDWRGPRGRRSFPPPDGRTKSGDEPPGPSSRPFERRDKPGSD